MLEKRLKCRATWPAARDYVGVLGGGRAEGGYREGQLGRRRGRVQLLWPEFFEQQQLLGVGLRPEQRAGLAVGGVPVRGLQGGRQHVVDAHRIAVAVCAIDQFKRALVSFWQGVEVEQGRGRVGRLIGVGRWVGRRRLAVVVHG
ncbi:hypothetical protein D3C76_1091020 [compost metagenome]